MPMHVSYVNAEFRLNLSFSGNLDVSVAQDICAICERPPLGLRSCIIDITDIDRLFDSGIALLKMLHRHLVENDVIVLILSNNPEIRQRIPAISHGPSPFFGVRNPVPSPIAGSTEWG